MLVSVDCYSVRAGYAIRNIILNCVGKIHNQFIVDTRGCKQQYDTNYSKGLVRLTYDMLQGEIIFIDLFTMSRCTAATIHNLRYLMDKRILEWLRSGDNNELISLYYRLVGADRDKLTPKPLTAKDFLKNWSSSSVLKGVRSSFTMWVDCEVYDNIRFVKSNTIGLEMYTTEKPLNVLDELELNLCTLDARRRNLPNYEKVKEIVTDAKVARTLFNSRIKHCWLSEHEGIPDYIVLTALRHKEACPNQLCYIYYDNNSHDPDVVERHSHDDEDSLVMTVIPRIASMKKVVVVTRKPVIIANSKQSVGYYVDVYNRISK